MIPSSPVATSPSRPDDSAAVSWNRVDWVACAAILVAALVMVALHVRTYETLSPIDELQHVDYMIRAGDFDIPVRNDRVGQEALSEAACRSVDSPSYVGPLCGLDSYDPNDFQERGFNTAASQFPPYYVITGVTARAVVAVGLFGSKVTAARMLGGVWLAAALSVTWYLMACLGIRRRARAPVTALLLVTPLAIFHAAATVNADVSLMLTGALAALATIKYEAGRLRWWWLPAVYVGVLFVEATNILAIAACGLYLVARRIGATDFSPLQRLAPLTILPGLLLFRLEISTPVHEWLFPQSPVDDASDAMFNAPMFANNVATGVSTDKIIGQLSATFTPVRNAYVSPPMRSSWTFAGVELTNWVFIALLIAAAVAVATTARQAWLARATVAALLAAGPFYTFYFAYFSNQDFGTPARFGLPLVPLMIVSAASAMDKRSAVWMVSVVAAITGINMVIQLVGA